MRTLQNLCRGCDKTFTFSKNTQISQTYFQHNQLHLKAVRIHSQWNTISKYVYCTTNTNFIQ